MAKCDCYYQHGSKPVCYGTKEMEECSCGGDESKCNFYPEKRKPKTANEKRHDLIDRQALGIGRCDPDAFPLQNRGYCAGWNGVIGLLEQAPRVDAVEVVWMPVLGFEGLYEISNLGKVRNHKGETLKQGIKRTNCTCYKLVNLWKDGRYYKKYVHRLIAEAFIPNPDNLPMVNHKDEDGTNNSIDNLEWCTREYNVNYGTAKERRAKKIRGVKHTEEHNKKISESMKRHFAKMDGDGNA